MLAFQIDYLRKDLDNIAVKLVPSCRCLLIRSPCGTANSAQWMSPGLAARASVFLLWDVTWGG